MESVLLSICLCESGTSLEEVRHIRDTGRGPGIHRDSESIENRTQCVLVLVQRLGFWVFLLQRKNNSEIIQAGGDHWVIGTE